MSRFCKLCCLLIALSLAGGVQVVFAQDDDAFMLEEITVTAERVEKKAQKTAVSMSVYSGENLIDAGVNNIKTLISIDPSINLTTSNGAGYLAMRGVSSTDYTEIGDPAVSIARDGFFTNRSFGIYSSFYDVERIEILKGPQGTLYGRNSSAGVINIISKKPTDTLGGYANLDAGDYGALNLEAAVNIPLNDKVQMRFSGVSLHHDPYRDNSPIVRGTDDQDSRSIRAQLAFQLSDVFSGLLSYQRDNTDEVGPGPAIGPFKTVYTVPDSKRYPLYTQPLNQVDQTRYRGEFSLQLPADLTLTYQGGFDKAEWRHRLSGSVSSDDAQVQFLQSENPDTWNHELRISTSDENRFFFQGGLFYFSEKNSPLDSGMLYQSGDFKDMYMIHFKYSVEATSKAAFGQATYKLTDQVKVSAGARYTKDHKERSGNALLDLYIASGGHVGPGPGIVMIDTPGNGDVDSSETTWHIGLEWTPTDTSMIYAKYDTGYKAGGFNSNGSEPSVPYDPETVKAIEIGSKNRFLNETVQANIALFHMKYEGYQASQSTPALGGAPGTQNAGDATIYGAEAQLIALITKGTQIDLNATYLHTEFDDFSVLDSDGNEVPVGGNVLPNSPEFTLTGGIEQAWSALNGTMIARVSGKYQSKFNYSFLNYPDLEQDAYFTGNASFSYTPADGFWTLMGYVKNFTDEDYWSHAERQAVVGRNNYEFAPPRTFGVKLEYRF